MAVASTQWGFEAAEGPPRHSEASTLAAKTPRLRREAARLAAELGSLGSEAARHSAAAERCVEALRVRAEELYAHLAEQSASSKQRADVVAHRQAVLEEEVRVLERRAEEAASGSCCPPGGEGGGGAGCGAWSARNTGVGVSPAWVAVEAERREALEARIAAANAWNASATEQARESVAALEERLASLREERREVHARAAARRASAAASIPAGAGAGTDHSWRARFQALEVAQHALADRAAAMGGADPGAERLAAALAAASAAARAAVDGPEHIGLAMRCVCGLAEAERRRAGLLRQGGGHDPRLAATDGLGSVPPVDRSFSPSQAHDWDLDLQR